MDSNDPLAFLTTLSTSELVLVAVKFGVPVSDEMIDWVRQTYPEKLERALALRERMLEAQQGANEGAIEETDPSENGSNPLLEPVSEK